MAVDCPDSFVGRNKTPPRYPPPRPLNQSQVIHTPNGNGKFNANKTKLTSSSSSSATSSFSSIAHDTGISLTLQPPTSNDSDNHHMNHNNIHNKQSPSLDSIAFGKKSSLKGPSSLGSTCDSIGFDSMSYQTKSRGSLSTRSSSSGELGPPEYDLGPHQERPIDVPDNFVEMAKAPPRYPPPKLQSVKEVVKSKESLTSNGSIDKDFGRMHLSTIVTPTKSSVAEVYFVSFLFLFLFTFLQFCTFIVFVFCFVHFPIFVPLLSYV